MLEIEKSIFDEFNISVEVGFEMEFYIDKLFEKKPDENNFLANILLCLSRLDISVLSVDKEVAVGQYEIALSPAPVTKALEDFEHLKNVITRACEKYDKKPLFDAKPHDNMPGCGLHIHIGLLDADSEKNLLMRVSERQESDIMLHAVGGLCFTMLKNFTSFAPNENSYKRFTSVKNQIKEQGNEDEYPLMAYNNAPVNVSWGGNNRTTAIRIPASSIDENKRHIEHRVAGIDASPKEAVEKILEGVYIGLKDKITPPEKIYGNAYDEQYDFLEDFPNSLEEAKNISKRFLN